MSTAGMKMFVDEWKSELAKKYGGRLPEFGNELYLKFLKISVNEVPISTYVQQA